MAYTINLTDGTIFATVVDGTVDNSSSITLIGKNVASYGELLDENYMRLLESHATLEAGVPPAPLTGQVWFDKTASTLKVFDGTLFKNLGSATPAGTEPPGAESVLGDIWFNTTTEQTYIYNGTDYVLIGTTTPLGTSPSDPVVTIISDGGADHVVVEYYVDGIRVAITSIDAEFTPSPAETGFATIKPGYNLSTDIAGTVFNGTSTNSNALDTFTSSQFLRSDQPDTTNSTLGILNDGGLTFGAGSDGELYIEAGDLVVLENTTLSADMQFRVNFGGSPTAALWIEGTTAEARCNSPQSGLGVVNLDYLETNFVSATAGNAGAWISDDIRSTDFTQTAWGDNEDFYITHGADNTYLINSVGDWSLTNNGGDIRIDAAVANGNVQVYGNGAIAASFGSSQQEVWLYYGGNQKFGTTLAGVSITGVATGSGAPTLDNHLTRKDYVDSRIVAVDFPTSVGVTIQSVTTGSWTDVLINANARYAFISAYAYGIFDTGGGQVGVYGRKKGLVGNAGLQWEIVETGSASGDAGSGSDSTAAGSVLVECDANGYIQIYGFRSSVSIIAPSGYITIKGWIE